MKINGADHNNKIDGHKSNTKYAKCYANNGNNHMRCIPTAALYTNMREDVNSNLNDMSISM